MISNRLSSEKIFVGVVLLIVMAAGAISYLSSSRKSVEFFPWTNDTQSVNNTNVMPGESAAIDSSASTQQESEKLTPAENVPPTPKPTQEELDKIDTSNWKTYTNADYGYEIKYPFGWSIITKEDFGVNFLAPETPQFNSDELGEGDIWISMQKSGPYYAPEWYYQKASVVINGNESTIYIGVNGGQDPQYPDISYTTLEVYKDSKKITINYPDHLQKKDGAKYIGVYYKMLDTFRFEK